LLPFCSESFYSFSLLKYLLKYKIYNLNQVKNFNSKIDETCRYLFEIEINNKKELIESVLMKYHHGYTACISTQSGCKMNCMFCATGKLGFSGNLTPSQMISQVQEIQKDKNIRVSNIVLMGMGEPLDNFNNTLRFLELITSPKGMNIGSRHISISTCGLADKILELSDKKLQVTLSVSLHAPNDYIRNKIMPVNKKFPIDILLNSCKKYIENTNKRITFEYILIKDLNDSDSCAEELSRKLKNMICHVNLIPVNPIKEINFLKSSKERIKSFCEILIKNKISVTTRRSLGEDINASCGQLKASYP